MTNTQAERCIKIIGCGIVSFYFISIPYMYPDINILIKCLSFAVSGINILLCMINTLD